MKRWFSLGESIDRTAVWLTLTNEVVGWLLAALVLAALPACAGGDRAGDEPVTTTAMPPSAAPAASVIAASPGGPANGQPPPANAALNIVESAANDSGAAAVGDGLTDDLPPAPATMGAGLLALKPQGSGDDSAGGPNLWVVANSLTVRGGPSKASPRVGALAYGEKVTAMGSEGGFVKIGEGRYVAKRFLTDRRSRFQRHPSQEMAH